MLDLCSKRLVGWSIADHMRTDLITDALQAAAAARGGGGLVGAVFHSDNRAQYASTQFATVCQELGVIRSRGAVGTSADNATAESFNASMKRETLQGAKHWAARLIQEAWRDSDSGALVWLTMTGARRGELCALRWSHVDLANGTVTIRR